MLKDYYTMGWPGSRLDSYVRFLRISQTQYILAGLVFIVGTLVTQLMLGQGRREVVQGFIVLVSVIWLFRFVCVMLKEGWRGKKGGAPPATL